MVVETCKTIAKELTWWIVKQEPVIWIQTAILLILLHILVYKVPEHQDKRFNNWQAVNEKHEKRQDAMIQMHREHIDRVLASWEEKHADMMQLLRAVADAKQ